VGVLYLSTYLPVCTNVFFKITVGTRFLVLPDGSIDCTSYRGNIAWHFSHFASHVALQEGIIEEPKPPPKSRAWYMRRFMRDFKFQCFVDQ